MVVHCCCGVNSNFGGSLVSGLVNLLSFNGLCNHNCRTRGVFPTKCHHPDPAIRWEYGFCDSGGRAYVFTVVSTSVAAAILAAVEGGILPPGMAFLSEELTSRPSRKSAGQARCLP